MAANISTPQLPATAFFNTQDYRTKTTSVLHLQQEGANDATIAVTTHPFLSRKDSIKEGRLSKDSYPPKTFPNESDDDDEENQDYSFFATPKFWLMFLAMCINVIMYALDQLIVTVAVPQIVDQFKAQEKIAWLNTGFFIPAATGILLYSQIMTIWNPRWVYLSALIIFEVGSAVCGSAKSMNILIFGRALAGLGGAGMWNATYLILTQLIPFAKRAALFGILGVFYILATVMGTLVGGGFTNMSHTGWRWCFYVNLPIGGLTIALLAVFLPTCKVMLPFDGKPDDRAWWQKLATIDWVGAILTLAFVTTLGIGTQWGGVTKAWSHRDVIGSFVACGVSFILLILWSIFLGPRAMVPMSLFKSAHFSAVCFVAFFAYGACVNMLYYLSVYFQAIKNTSPIRTGVVLLGLQASICFFLVLSAKFGERTGYAKAPMVIGSIITAIAIGIYTTIGTNTTIAVTVGLEVLAGCGCGLVMNLMTVIMQAEFVSRKSMSLWATNVFNFWGFIGRIICLTVATNVFENKLKLSLYKVREPGMSVEIGTAILASPKAIASDIVPDTLRPTLRTLYAKAISDVWWVTTAVALCLVVSCLLLKDIRINSVNDARKTNTNAGSEPKPASGRAGPVEV